MKRKLAPEEALLWKRVIASVTPMPGKRVEAGRPALPDKDARDARANAAKPAPAPRAAPADKTVLRPNPAPPKKEASNTLDASWDRRLGRGLVSPDSSIDLHGHSLASAYDRLDHGLDFAIRRGDRVLLLVTGKPPRAESERPHARGAIRAAVGDWLASSRHSDKIAAVRGAHPRHGGTGALYIVLRRPRLPAPGNS
ncbi:Smr/MutS family protein [Sphingomonas sp. MMS12-HWE2-04]|uniref:Smr/MutS family protein n=1 Tax=Sphingomonas sp. MMS12-HWE2-04 TaxID=3234199 RepID=UPI00384CA315